MNEAMNEIMSTNPIKSINKVLVCRRGQTLVEILIVAAIMVILGALSIDLFRPSSDEKIQGAVRMFAQDAEWARGATLTNPDDGEIFTPPNGSN